MFLFKTYVVPMPIINQRIGSNCWLHPITVMMPIKKPKDPVAALVEREIKPIIKKWISKNLKSFVKTIVIEEMKLISKATQKHK